MTAIEPLGIDNVMFDVADLGDAIAFYERCGFRLKARIDAKDIAILGIGSETPGLILRQGLAHGGGRLWVEVSDAETVASILEAEGVQVSRLVTGTGRVSEISDPSGNRIGFVDYSIRPELGRGRPDS